jgi:anti-sigma-K factor RskA
MERQNSAMPTHHELSELIPAYALGCLDPEDAALVSNHMSGCSLCRSEAHTYTVVVNQLALAVPQSKTTPDLEQRLMERVQSGSISGSAKASGSAWKAFLNLFRGAAPVWGGIGLVLIVGLVAANLFLWQQLTDEQSTTGPAGMHYVTLTPSARTTGASGVIVVSSDGEYGALVVENLPQLPAGREYQFWLIDDEQRTPGPNFSVSDHGYQALEVEVTEPLGSFDGFSITVEPAGGSKSPTGQTVLYGEF